MRVGGLYPASRSLHGSGAEIFHFLPRAFFAMVFRIPRTIFFFFSLASPVILVAKAPLGFVHGIASGSRSGMASGSRSGKPANRVNRTQSEGALEKTHSFSRASAAFGRPPSWMDCLDSACPTDPPGISSPSTLVEPTSRANCLELCCRHCK